MAGQEEQGWPKDSPEEPDTWDTDPPRGCRELTANSASWILSRRPLPAPRPDALRGDGVWVAAPGAEGHGQLHR